MYVYVKAQNKKSPRTVAGAREGSRLRISKHQCALLTSVTARFDDSETGIGLCRNCAAQFWKSL